MLQDQKKERITIHRNHLVPYYLKENNIREELQNYLLDKRSNFETTQKKTVIKIPIRTKNLKIINQKQKIQKKTV